MWSAWRLGVIIQPPPTSNLQAASQSEGSCTQQGSRKPPPVQILSPSEMTEYFQRTWLMTWSIRWARRLKFHQNSWWCSQLPTVVDRQSHRPPIASNCDATFMRDVPNYFMICIAPLSCYNGHVVPSVTITFYQKIWNRLIPYKLPSAFW